MFIDCSISRVRNTIFGEYVKYASLREDVELSLYCQVLILCLHDQTFQAMQGGFSNDRLDTAASNMVGAAAGVLIACVLCHTISRCRRFYGYRLIKKDGEEHSKGYDCLFSFMRCLVKVYSRLGLNRTSDIQKLQMEQNITVQQKELHDPAHPRNRIDLDWDTENLFLETLVGAQDVNIWSILMPAVYQLVPGSIIAKLWYHSIFQRENASNVDPQENVFSSLMGKRAGPSYALCYVCRLSRHMLLMVDRATCALFSRSSHLCIIGDRSDLRLCHHAKLQRDVRLLL